ncbi:MAG: zinc ribbon domain-containing protein [Anaerolineae bacterium]
MISLGAILVGMSLLLVVVAYVARPFRTATAALDPQKAIESWVAQVREEQDVAQETGEIAVPGLRSDRINYCPACGRQVSLDDRFCSGCGAGLRGGKA